MESPAGIFPARFKPMFVLYRVNSIVYRLLKPIVYSFKKQIVDRYQHKNFISSYVARWISAQLVDIKWTRVVKGHFDCHFKLLSPQGNDKSND